MTNLEEKLGYHFQNPDLLRTALSHSSYANEHHLQSYERFEFLGDSILGMFVAEFLFTHFPKLSEGNLTRTRARLVCEEALVEVAHDLGLSQEIQLGRGELIHGARPSICADVVEALLAAIYLDGGVDEARQFVTTFILSRNPEKYSGVKDFKSALQELVQKRTNQNLNYQLVDQRGPDHMKEFEVEVFVNDQSMGKGIGRSKKEAEQQAAKTAYFFLKEDS